MANISNQSGWLERVLRFVEKLIPKSLYRRLQPLYHYLLALVAGVLYRFPARKMVVIAVTGTKGKTSTVELLNAILSEAGLKTATASTVQFKIGDEVSKNMYKMTLPGRFFLQRFLRRALNAQCTHAVVEVTSEATKLFRHKYLFLNALLFTNISPEHIESHGSFEKYLKAKLKLATALKHSPKKNKFIVSNIDDEYGERFISTATKGSDVVPVPFSLNDIEYSLNDGSVSLEYNGVTIRSGLEGVFNVMNILSAIVLAEKLGISLEVIKKAVEGVTVIRGRVEHINEGQSFSVVVDYAHTPDSLEKLYQAFPGKTKQNKICVLGNTGGGRDTWKRPEMGRIAEQYCTEVILTNEDPYDENPEQILADMAKGMSTKPIIIMDRREAIAHALAIAQKTENAIVLISGKGTDPYIMEVGGKKTPWSDADVTREELKKLHLNKEQN